MREYKNVYIFPTFFTTNFLSLRKKYKEVAKFDKSGGLMNYDYVMIPLLLHCHWFLCYCEFKKNRIYVLDPYIEAALSLQNLKNQHMTTLDTLERKFLKPHFRKKYSMELQDLQKVVLLPPQIPEQHGGSHCGCFMIQLAR